MPFHKGDKIGFAKGHKFTVFLALFIGQTIVSYIYYLVWIKQKKRQKWQQNCTYQLSLFLERKLYDTILWPYCLEGRRKQSNNSNVTLFETERF